MFEYMGEMAALLTAFCWMLSSLCWTAAGERVGSLAVNIIRLVIAMPMLLVFALFSEGEILPFSASPHTWLWLGISGALGFFVCDLFLFHSFLLIGPRLGMLFLSLSPPLTALIGWLVLGEGLTLTNCAGMGLTLAGVVWVVIESPASRGATGRRYVFSAKGGLMAFVAAAAQAVAMVTAKVGVKEGCTAVAATEIRLVAGLECFLVLVLILRRSAEVMNAMRNVRAMGIMSLGAVCGPFVGVIFMMEAVKLSSTGLAQTFLSTAPVMIIPFMWLIYRERVGWQAVAGAVVACTGVALLFLK